jgi:methylase of polypeptide subunit release factors
LAFRKLAQEIQPPNLVATVGAGSGLDGIAMYETFRPRNLKMIDVNPNVIDITHSNLNNYFTNAAADLKWKVTLGNLCSPLAPEEADLIYANIPTLPGDPSQILSAMNSSSFFDPAWAPSCPKNLAKWNLALKHEFLLQAHRALRAGGSAVIALGVRMPAEAVDKLFRATGYGSFETVILDLKEQSQPKTVLSNYAMCQRSNGVEFEFYNPDALAHKPDTSLPLQDFKKALEPWRLTASEALVLSLFGHKIYHVIAILRAVK